MDRYNNTSGKKSKQGFTMADLAPLPVWAVWRDAGRGKAPINAKTGRAASSTKSATWATRDEATRRANRYGDQHPKGVGVMLTNLEHSPGLRLCGIDIDGCREAETGYITGWVQPVLHRFDSYAEASPSGTGLRVLFLCHDADVDSLRAAGLIRPQSDGSPGAGRSFDLPGDHTEIAVFFERKFLSVTGYLLSDHEQIKTVDLESLEWLLGEHGPSVQADGVKPGKDTSGSGEAWRFLQGLARLGHTEEEAREAIAADDGPAGEWWGRVDERQQDRAIERGFGVVSSKLAASDALLTEDDVTPRKTTLTAFRGMLTEEQLVKRMEEYRTSLDAEAFALMWGDGEEDKPVTPKEWGEPMNRENGQPIINLHNTVIYLGRNLDTVLPGLAHNLMTHRDEWKGGEIDDEAISLARIALEARGLKTVGKELVADAIRAVAKKLSYHPIRDHLNALRWDGEPRLDTWLIRLSGAEDTPYTRAVSRKFPIQMVARVMKPGCKADYTMVWSGEQGQDKSKACRILAGAEYFSDTLPSIRGSKEEALRHLQGLWLVELAELAPSFKADQEDQKAFLSGSVDRVRLPYARFPQSFRRQCVFIGTTNEDQFLKDPTGGRRYWPVAIRQVFDTEGLEKERDQLFAEATHAFNEGEEWWLDREFEAEHVKPVQAAAYEEDSWAMKIGPWLDKPAFDEDDDTPSPKKDETTVAEVLSDALGIPAGQQTRANQNRAAANLRTLGWTKHHTREGKVWRRAQP
ncbi:hypothetical protein EI983_08350 [Roseovarius faecimaris]|uniref:Virulence-associated protein E-like domain-containing protein n=1 Tax=Roseovarius faecimaris TaxID=2494550 RepID=A0A6I6IR03_9RHOB|nr:virulence-associated E family protein [Roseovarius faecimaris]QGX98293.1 hypothetical protein EI983_08350 [Roseovarius faecimaris]